jgi:hypothetical protein
MKIFHPIFENPNFKLGSNLESTLSPKARSTYGIFRTPSSLNPNPRVCLRYNMVHFQRSSNTNSNLIGWEQNLGPNEFALGSGSKVWKSQVVLMGHHFSHHMSLVSIQENTHPGLRNLSSSFGLIFSLNLQSIQGVLDPSSLNPYLKWNPP